MKNIVFKIKCFLGIHDYWIFDALLIRKCWHCGYIEIIEYEKKTGN